MPPMSSKNLSRVAALQPEKLIGAASPTCAEAISEATRNVTSSPALGDGRSPSSLPDGPTIDLFGQVLAPANRSVPRENGSALATNGTFGPSGSVSSASVRLQLSLENRFRQRKLGWHSSEATLSEAALLSLLEKSEHLTSVPRIDVAAFGSLLPTPTAKPGGYNLGGGSGRVGKIRPSLEHMARHGLWPTPGASANENRQTQDHTPSQAAGKHGLSLAAMANLWPTPTASLRSGLQSHGRNAILGVLNPQWVAWLMGYPTDWLSPLSEFSATPSSRKLRRSSSPQQAKLSDRLNDE